MLVRIAVSGPFESGLDYLCSDETIEIFSRVLVSIGARKCIGFVIEKNITPSVNINKIKSIINILDKKPIFSDIDQKIILWMANYYHASVYSIIKISLPKKIISEQNPQVDSVEYYKIQPPTKEPSKGSPKQLKLFNYLKEKNDWVPEAEIILQDYNKTIINAMIEKQIITSKSKQSLPENSFFDENDDNKQLTDEQKTALKKIGSSSGFATYLLYGITGSGKTEVYLQSIKNIINQGKQVLVLVPEINLTPQTLLRFQKRFNQPVIAVNSKTNDQTKFNNWSFCKNNQAKIIISTRSGLLFSFADIGMIIVDEEHDASFKQQSGVRYNARDIAIIKAKHHNIPIILGSATPSIESYYHSQNNKYTLIQLTKRPHNYKKTIQIINMQNAKYEHGISTKALNEINEQLKNNRQSLIFINRRGYANSLICKSCGWCASCSSCDKPYTLHLNPQHLSCHFCGKGKSILLECQQCKSGELITYGSGTEKIEEHLINKFNKSNVLRFDKSETQNKGSLERKLEQITNMEADIIVGTQMIAKGHHFEGVAMVCIVNIDAGFYSSDFHAIERTGQLLVQVIGRAGRCDNKGKIIIQSYQPENPYLQQLLNHDYLVFLDKLLIVRKLLEYPPYTFQAVILSQAVSEQKALSGLSFIYNKIKQYQCSSTSISQPIKAIHFKKNNKYRYSIILTSNKRSTLHNILRISRLSYINLKIKISKISFDIDPSQLD